MECWRRKKEKGKEKEKEKEKEKAKEKGEASKLFLRNGSMFLQELIADCNGISNPIRMFSSDQISKATNHFDPNCKCSISDLFTGVIEGRSYAIKKLIYDSDKCEPEDYKDIVISARVSSHSGFLKLTGCCLEFPFPVVVFEKPEYGALNRRGSVGPEEALLLPWNVRLKIAKEVAIAVTYLHTAFPRTIIHRDINFKNVMLDKNWTAKLTDFSRSITLPEGKTWIEDGVMGTPGYIDPVYYTTGIVTEYTDVYSFGILMLVLLMGMPAFLRNSTDQMDNVVFEYVKFLLARRASPSFFRESKQWLGPEGGILGFVKHLQERGETIRFGGDSNDMRPAQMNMFFDLALRCCEKRNEDRPKMILVAKEIKRIQGSLDC